MKSRRNVVSVSLGMKAPTYLDQWWEPGAAPTTLMATARLVGHGLVVTLLLVVLEDVVEPRRTIRVQSENTCFV